MTGTYRAKLGASASRYAYSRRLAVAAEGKYAVRAFHYRAGKLVTKSALTSFDVARRITIDSNVNGWMAPSLARHDGSPRTRRWTSSSPPRPTGPPDDPAKHNGAAHFIWGDFEKVDADGLIWHTDGLRAGRYDWMRDAMPKWGTGCLVVAQQIDIDKISHDDTHALPYLPADISFGDVSSAGMGCDRSIAFVTAHLHADERRPARVAHRRPGPRPLRLEVLDGRAATTGRWWPTVPAQQVAIDSDPHETR